MFEKGIDKVERAFYNNDKISKEIINNKNTRKVDRMGKYVDFYCGNNNRELKRMVDSILAARFNWISQKDYDEFYSLASLVVWNCEKKSDEDISSEAFRSYLFGCILNRIKSRLTYMNRDRRVMKDYEGNIIYDISIDTPIDNSGDDTLSDILIGSFDVETRLLREDESQYSPGMRAYLSRLSAIQKKVLGLITAGFSPDRIKEDLHISEKEYEDCKTAIHSYRNVSVLLQS